jgi:AraC-like DNA-binding protein
VADATSQSVIGRPAPWVRPFVDSYVGYRLVGAWADVHRGLPSPHLTFIVSIGDPIEVVAQVDPRQRADSYDFVLGGLQDRSALVAVAGGDEGVTIGLTPLGCRALLGVPAAALWNLSLEAADVLGGAAAELRERLHVVTFWADRFAVCDEVLGRLLAPDDRLRPVAPEVREAWRMLVRSGGTTPIATVIDEVGWSRRHLAQRFRDELGLSPKAAARIIRFDRARTMLQGPQRPAIADVAADCGYYDQSHLTRDFVELAGCPPGEWLASEVTYVQDGDRPEPADSTA